MPSLASQSAPTLSLSEVSDSESQPLQSDGAEDDEFYGDQDDVQSFMQPAISPIATRLTSPRTPAAEKAAAMEHIPGGGLFDALDNMSPGLPSLLVSEDGTDLSRPNHSNNSHGLSPAEGLPAPWQAGPKEFAITEPTSPRTSSISAVFGQSRLHRSSSVGENALKRLSKALPSISIPTGLIPNIPTPSFWASLGSPFQREEHPASPPHLHRSSLAPELALDRPDSRSYALRKSTSDDSLLYHSLSRVSSFGDDERFAHVREQVNSRFKAIKDSWDGPSFKMPQFPNLLNAPPKKSATEPSMSVYRSGTIHNSQRSPRDGISPLDSALESLTGDVVVMGGYRGSILRSAQPPHRQLWVPVKVGLKIRKVNMEVGLEPKDEEDMGNHIFASGMLQNIGPVDISKKLFKKLRECDNARTGRLRVHDYGYDWRLSPHLLSRKLIEFLEKLPSNQPGVPEANRGALVIAHSLGGIITRHAVNQRPELFSGVVFAGTPQRCINILGPVRNGDAVLLNEKVLTAQVNLSLRTTFVFLPEDGFCFVDKTTKEEYPIDFYNAEEWVKHRLSPCVSEPVLAPLSRSSSTLGSLLSLSDSLPSLPLRGRSNSHQPKKTSTEAVHRGLEITKDRSPHLGAAVLSASSVPPLQGPKPASTTSPSPPSPNPSTAARARNMAYLRRVLAETKKFRAELAHKPTHQEANVYPPLAVIYGKDTPTVFAARVAGREGIPCADAYDDLVFHGGDGVVLARESMLPPGYELAKDGRICTDRGHVSILGDLHAVGRALEAVLRGRRKGIGMGKEET
ncbi:hypothetical protein B0T25DRAFT_449624 [Lasiosphaeria hispida]|uniref:Phosphatidylcholine-sterol O-acyltransferase-like protein n=1 Tax=Lasiosphaeria hispida TaxID=260671 RepID=A0AAJ0HLZ2_9PEZI|nr:hypothetical protein B0T25DRAFT_449624 [Lasiosphaeria hispida]